jgi:hypothetical protein
MRLWVKPAMTKQFIFCAGIASFLAMMKLFAMKYLTSKIW